MEHEPLDTNNKTQNFPSIFNSFGQLCLLKKIKLGYNFFCKVFHEIERKLLRCIFSFLFVINSCHLKCKINP